MKNAATALGLALLLLAAGPQDKRTRPFAMGVNPFPYEITAEAVEATQLWILDNTDLAAVKFDEGVPWQEALENKNTYDPAFESSIDWKGKKPQDKKVFLSLTPLNKDKTGMAGYRGAFENMPNPDPWNKKDLDDPLVAKAYLNFCREMIRRFKPDYLAYGLEVNNLIKVPAKWKKFVLFARDIYVALKKENPQLPLILTLSTETATDPEQIGQQRKAIGEILPVTDLIAVTAIPYLKEPNPAKIPKNYFAQMAALAPQKPFAIAETAFLAEDVNVDLGALHIERVGKAAWQADYLRFCFEEGVKHNAKFIVWMIPRDLDKLYDALPPLVREIILPIRDTGLMDGAGNPRKSFELWSQWLKYPRSK
ncbi:MAG TPA: hypothetical protein VE981_00040 [Planctomycetota bacterium]|nr:hypothetical protein [Planctomycetota bacterium]